MLQSNSFLAGQAGKQRVVQYPTRNAKPCHEWRMRVASPPREANRCRPRTCTRRSAGAAVDQIRVCHQSANSAGARHRSASRGALHCRRGDRIVSFCCGAWIAIWVDFFRSSGRAVRGINMVCCQWMCRNPASLVGGGVPAAGKHSTESLSDSTQAWGRSWTDEHS